jgi:hypothetical protein
MSNEAEFARALCSLAVKNAGVEPEDLDNMVHDAASGLAESVCNEGIESQIEFLIENGYNWKDILEDALLEKETREATDALDQRRGVMP